MEEGTGVGEVAGLPGDMFREMLSLAGTGWQCKEKGSREFQPGGYRRQCKGKGRVRVSDAVGVQELVAFLFRCFVVLFREVVGA